MHVQYKLLQGLSGAGQKPLELGHVKAADVVVVVAVVVEVIVVVGDVVKVVEEDLVVVEV